MDAYELDETIQKKTQEIMHNTPDEQLFNLSGTTRFINDFYQINGFAFDTIDYTQDVDMEALSALTLK